LYQGTISQAAQNSVQDALCQGTTLVVPFSCVKEHGFSRCNGMQGLNPV
jgi:hypothetical protein